MAPKDFYNTYFPYALRSELITGVPALFTLAQAALESGWAANVKGNNFFGIKDTDGINGNEIEFLTTEFNKGKWIKIKQWFRLYKTPAESFTDHGNFLRKNPRYANAFQHKDNSVEFAKAVAAAGYATDPKYADKVITIINMLKKYGQ